MWDPRLSIRRPKPRPRRGSRTVPAVKRGRADTVGIAAARQGGEQDGVLVAVLGPLPEHLPGARYGKVGVFRTFS
jgi:hypothetical protein